MNTKSKTDKTAELAYRESNPNWAYDDYHNPHVRKAFNERTLPAEKPVFIPDNSDGGTWETWKDDRPNYKAHADALAEALQRFVEAYRMESDHDLECAEAIAREALAAYEAAR